MSHSEVLYRFKETHYSGSTLMLLKFEFPILKRTKCGAWIDEYGHKRFVNLNAHKKYACQTVEEAFESFQARKKRQIRILKQRLAEAEAALKLTPENDAVYFGLVL